MSKHSIITDNLKALTRARSFESAVQGWTVKKIVTLSRKEQQACELCGTRFRAGAVVRHPSAKATILVGGTCLKTLQSHRFPKSFDFKNARKLMLAALAQRYGPLVDPGNWLKWTIENAPGGLAQAAADLQTFGTVLNDMELDRLIRFHDRHRLFRRNALLEDPALFEQALGIKIPRFVTIEYASKLSNKKELLRLAPKLKAAHYWKTKVKPRIDNDSDLVALWPSLTQDQQRAVTAFAALDERAAEFGEPLCADNVAPKWPAPATPPMFVWHTKIGLGFVGSDDTFQRHNAHVWLWRSGAYQRKIYSLAYWLGVVGCSTEAVDEVEQLAFAKQRTSSSWFSVQPAFSRRSEL